MTEPATPAPSAVPAPSEPLRHPAVWRLILCAVLFALWLAYLAVLVLMRQQPQSGPRLLSRPQALVSTLDVVADVTPGRRDVVVKEVLYPGGRDDLVDKTLTVRNLPDLPEPGLYLLLFAASDGEQADLARLPASPGFSLEGAPPRVYAATPDIRAQYHRVVKPARD